MTFGPSTLVDLPARPRRAVRVSFGIATLAAVAALVAACTSGNARVASGSAGAGGSGSGTSSTSTSPSASTSAPVTTASITTDPADGSKNVNPVAPISVSVADGKLTSLVMTNASGKQVTGALGAGAATWHSTEVLGYGRTYTVQAKAVNAAGATTSKKVTFTTLDPNNTVDASLDRMGGYGLDDETYGVGIIPVVHFDSPVKNEAAVQKVLSVTSSPAVQGVWSWRDNEDVAYRPESFWPADTNVTVTANVYGIDVGDGVYGAADQSVSFTIGRRQITVADDNAPNAVDKVRVYNAANQVLRTMNTSMGQHSGETVDGQYINFYTLNGTYTVLEHDNPAIMDSQSYGLPANAPNGYGKLSVPYSTKISTDGIYLHEYNSTIYDQDNGIDVSEGCLNLRTSDAVWFYDHSLIGDPVVVHGAKGAPEIQPWEGGYWSESWATWQQGSALT